MDADSINSTIPGVVALVTALSLAGCGPDSQEAGIQSTHSENVGKVVFATAYPAYFFASRLLPAGADLRYGPGSEGGAEGWRPDGEQLELMAQADAILLNGAGFEDWIEKVSLPDGIVYSLSAEWPDEWIELEDAVVHSHGEEGEHSHAGLASMVWLNPRLAQRQVVEIERIAVELFPEDQTGIHQQSLSLQAELEELDAAFQSALSILTTRQGFASHPVYAYFAARYDLSIRSMHWEPGVEPSPQDWDSFDDALELHPTNWMLWEGEPGAKNREQLESRGVKPIVLRTAVDRPSEGDFLTLMAGSVAEVEAILD